MLSISVGHVNTWDEHRVKWASYTHCPIAILLALLAEDQEALDNCHKRSNPSIANGNPQYFIGGTSGYAESHSNVQIYSLPNQGRLSDPVLFISAGSGGGSGYIYLDWVIATFGVPYVVTVPQK